jgi:hypothetical protein
MEIHSQVVIYRAIVPALPQLDITVGVCRHTGLIIRLSRARRTAPEWTRNRRCSDVGTTPNRRGLRMEDLAARLSADHAVPCTAATHGRSRHSPYHGTPQPGRDLRRNNNACRFPRVFGMARLPGKLDRSRGSAVRQRRTPSDPVTPPPRSPRPPTIVRAAAFLALRCPPSPACAAVRPACGGPSNALVMRASPGAMQIDFKMTPLNRGVET